MRVHSEATFSHALIYPFSYISHVTLAAAFLENILSSHFYFSSVSEFFILDQTVSSFLGLCNGSRFQCVETFEAIIIYNLLAY